MNSAFQIPGTIQYAADFLEDSCEALAEVCATADEWSLVVCPWSVVAWSRGRWSMATRSMVNGRWSARICAVAETWRYAVSGPAMELFGRMLSVPAGFVASAVYCRLHGVGVCFGVALSEALYGIDGAGGPYEFS
jgi:hypothetical protein